MRKRDCFRSGPRYATRRGEDAFQHLLVFADSVDSVYSSTVDFCYGGEVYPSTRRACPKQRRDTAVALPTARRRSPFPFHGTVAALPELGFRSVNHALVTHRRRPMLLRRCRNGEPAATSYRKRSLCSRDDEEEVRALLSAL